MPEESVQVPYQKRCNDKSVVCNDFRQMWWVWYASKVQASKRIPLTHLLERHRLSLKTFS